MIKFNTITVMFALFCSLGMYAQEENVDGVNHTRQGRFLIGSSTNGGLNFTKSSSEFQGDVTNESKSSRFNLSGSAGYFFIDNLVGGIELSYGTSTFESENFETENKGWSVNAGPFIAYYFDVGTPHLRPYLRGATGFGFGKSESSTVVFNNGEFESSFLNTDTRRRSFVYRLGAGVAFFLNDTVAINVEAAYRNNTNKDPDDDFDSKSKSSNIGLNAGFSIFL